KRQDSAKSETSNMVANLSELSEARPNSLTPGVSIKMPLSSINTISLRVEVCRPLPEDLLISDVVKTVRPHSALINELFPTPDDPTNTIVSPRLIDSRRGSIVSGE